MKSVGEAMALGRTFPEALLKAVQSLEIGVDFLDGSGVNKQPIAYDVEKLSIPTADRLFRVYQAIHQGISLEEISRVTGYDLWFLAQMKEIETRELEIRDCKSIDELKPLLHSAKQMGFADSYIARILNSSFIIPHSSIRELRKSLGILPTFQRVDTCAAEFESQTPYLYSAYEMEDESRPTDKQKILILGGGPNRIGQGIEFD